MTPTRVLHAKTAKATSGNTSRSVSLLVDLALLTASVLLFAFSFPSGISKWGLFPLAFIALVPLFILVHRANWVSIFFYGLFYGFLSYSVFNFWLLKFHPLAIFIVPTIYGIYFLVFLPVLKLADTWFPRYGFLVQSLLWVGYEYLKTTRFLGYSYGILGYSQYLFLPLLSLASITGVWGLSFLVVFPSAFLGNAFKRGRPRVFFKDRRLFILLYGGLFSLALLIGFTERVNFEQSPRWRVALIQHNVDPWKNNYADSLRLLIELSKEAVKESPDIVVWSETAFIPAIDYHTRHRTNPAAYELVKKLKEFLSSQKVPYVLGNDDGQLELLGGAKRVDYNASLLFENGEFRQIYRKTHLVPFTENFPFEKQFPGIYNLLVKADTHFWKKGDEYTVFSIGGVKFSTPICFEDTFGYLSREFVKGGADVIVNITNDSWSHSVPAEMQHMAMAVFRAVENRRSLVRSTNGGITCTIDPNGRIIAMIPPFKEDYLVSDIPLFSTKTTLYTKWGDWFAVGALVLSIFLLLSGGLLQLKGKLSSK